MKGFDKMWTATWDEQVWPISERINVRTRKTRALCPYRAGPKIKRFWKVRNWWNVGNEGNWTGRNRMGRTNFACNEERWLTSIFCGLMKIRCGDRTWLLPFTQNRRVHQFTWRGINIFHFRRWSWLLASRDRRAWLQKICIHLTSRVIPILPYDIRTLHAGLSNGPLTSFSHQSNGSSSWCIWVTLSSFLELQTITSNMVALYCSCCTEQASCWRWKSASYLQKRSAIVDRWYPMSIEARFSYYRHNRRLRNTLSSNRTEVILGFMKSILTLRFQLCANCCPAQPHTNKGGTQAIWQLLAGLWKWTP